MKTSKAFVIVAIVFSVLVTGAWALVVFAGVKASLLLTGVIGLITWSVRSQQEQKKERMRLLAESKRAHYLEFLQFMNRLISAGKEDLSSNKEFLQELRMWSLRLTLIGSDGVVSAWNAARGGKFVKDGDQAGISALVGWGALWLEMRKDAGHADTKLKISDVLASFVNDIENYDLDELATTSERGT
jgi:hypothetical protein